MILLGVNCGFGNSDCGTLPLKSLDLEGGWVNYHRPKTASLAAGRSGPRRSRRSVWSSQNGRNQRTRTMLAWYSARSRAKACTRQATATRSHRKRGNFSTRSASKGTGVSTPCATSSRRSAAKRKYQVAVNHIMGHAARDMSSVYRERISDERLMAVSEQVRKWVFGEKVGR